MEVPQTLPEGQISLAAAVAVGEDEDGTKAPFGALKLRGGVAPHLDVGMRVDAPFLNFMVDAKYQPLQTEAHGLDLAFLGGVGIMSIFHFQAILGREIGPFQIYTSYRYQLLGIPHLDLTQTIDNVEASIQQGFAGIRLKLIPYFFCQGEGGYILRYEIHTVAVGCGILFPNVKDK